MSLKVNKISKKLGGFELTNINFEVKKGEYFVLLGPTGAGKTVLLELIMGFHDPDEGTIFLDSRDITHVPTAKRGLGYVPQNCPLFPHMTVSENVEFGLKMQRKPSAERREAVDQMLKMMGLESIGERTPEALSGGERQKVVLARTLATQPRVILLDEPLASIDVMASRGLKEEFKRISRELDVAIMHVTHDQIEAFSLADRLAIMRSGTIVQHGHPTEVLSDPGDEFVARFLGYTNVFQVNASRVGKDITDVEVDGVKITLSGAHQGGGGTIAIKPEDITVAMEPLRVSSDWNVFVGVLKAFMDLGPIVEIVVDSGIVLRAFVDKRSFLEKNLSEGKTVHVGFRYDSVKIVGNG